MASVDDLWLVDFGEPYPGEPAAYRPAVVLGPPVAFGADLPFVIVAPLTTTWRGLSLHIEVEDSSETGLDETSYVQCELIRSVNRRRLVHRLGHVGADTSGQIASVVKTLLNL
ncbi:type II toxin-antitoxin system PemK/MazF family toxin [Candidatus Poriferisocius sp.]|uniref:type II toxin-antitoxin system PemK/MazF family toxin n=1 Tax=Candidatus Poriferisocius sp. TaxID=3101276 RepID=UPI003B5911D1